MVNGKAKLKKGERSAKWYGKTWKSKLFVEDRIAIKRDIRLKLVNALSHHIALRREAEKHIEVKMPPKSSRKRRTFRPKLWQVALIAAILLTAMGLNNISFLRQGLNILHREGPKSAASFFQDKGESYDHMFGRAWAAFRSGDYDQATELGEQVLESAALKDQARGWYLLGVIQTNRSDYENAKESLLNALVLYETLGKIQSQYETYLALAKLFLAQKQVANATYYANLAKNAGTASDQYLLYIQSQIAFLQDDYERALALSIERETLAKGNRSRLIGVYSDIGFYYGLVGNKEKCLDYTIRAQNIATEQEDTKSLVYNKLNMCLYLKCSMQDYSHLKESILNYARSHKEVNLLEMMYFVDKFHCPMFQIDNGDPNPPDLAETIDPGRGGN